MKQLATGEGRGFEGHTRECSCHFSEGQYVAKSKGTEATRKPRKKVVKALNDAQKTSKTLHSDLESQKEGGGGSEENL